MYLCNIYTCRQAQSLETTKKWGLCQLFSVCRYGGLWQDAIDIIEARPRNWKGAKLGAKSSQLAQVMEYTEIDPATEGFNKAQWEKNLLLLVVFFGVMFFFPVW